MKRFLLCCCLAAVTSVFAQKEKNIWYFGLFGGIDFNSGSPVALTDGKMTTAEGCASIADSDGKLLFYTDGITVRDNSHSIMPNGTGLKGHSSSTQSAIIVRSPGSSSLYFIFTTAGEQNNNNSLQYSTVDMTLNGGRGDIVQKNVLLHAPVTEKVTAVRHSDGKSIWIITHEWNSNKFIVYLLSNSGIQTSVTSALGSIHKGTYGNTIGYLKASPDGRKLALATWTMRRLEVFDFDNNTGDVANVLPLPSDSLEYGVSFSPDNSRLYTGTWSNTGYNTIYQYNMLAGDSAKIVASKTLVGSYSGATGYGALQLAPDGKIYIAKYNSNFLSVINTPNGLGTACNFANDAFSLGGKRSGGGLPNFLDENGPCNLLSVSFANHHEASTGNCCSELTLHNLLQSNLIYSIGATVLTPGVTVKSASGPWDPQPSYSATSITWSIPSPGLPKGNRDSLFACFSNLPDSSVRLTIDWLDIVGRIICSNALNLSCKTVSIDDPESDHEKFSLERSYPDPASTHTQLWFSLSKEERITLSLRDVLGREVVRVIDNKLLDEGKHGVDVNVGALPSGIYFCTLRTTTASTTITMRVVR